MRIVEESYLKRTVAQLNSYAAERDTYLGLFGDINAFETEPLQDLSFRGDLAYFERVSFILSVITSIISNPHISQTGENIIIRAFERYSVWQLKQRSCHILMHRGF